MTETKYFYKLAAQLHSSMTEEQQGVVEEFMEQFDALEYYKQLATPDPEIGGPAQLEEHATTMAIVLMQLVPMDALGELYESLGISWEEAFDFLKAKFDGLV